MWYLWKEEKPYEPGRVPFRKDYRPLLFVKPIDMEVPIRLNIRAFSQYID